MRTEGNHAPLAVFLFFFALVTVMGFVAARRSARWFPPPS